METSCVNERHRFNQVLHFTLATASDQFVFVFFPCIFAFAHTDFASLLLAMWNTRTSEKGERIRTDNMNKKKLSACSMRRMKYRYIFQNYLNAFALFSIQIDVYAWEITKCVEFNAAQFTVQLTMTVYSQFGRFAFVFACCVCFSFQVLYVCSRCVTEFLYSVEWPHTQIPVRMHIAWQKNVRIAYKEIAFDFIPRFLLFALAIIFLWTFASHTCTCVSVCIVCWWAESRKHWAGEIFKIIDKCYFYTYTTKSAQSFVSSFRHSIESITC